MFAIFWNDVFYQPLFNVLIWIYNNWTDQNLGWAVVYLTIMLRVVLLPLTVVEEKNKRKNDELLEDIKRIDKDFGNDQVLKKEEIRRALRKKRVKPWAKTLSLGIQALVLVLLYQVFLRGITGQKLLHILYPSIDFPGVINTIFYGFDLAQTHTYIWPGIVTVVLFLEIYKEYSARKFIMNKRDLLYFFLFPCAVFVILWYLPMVKSLFILTSMLFSVIIEFSFKLFSRPKKAH